MKPDISQHPDFPFGAESAAKEEGWSKQFLNLPTDATHAALLREFVQQVHAYAFLERLIQGDVRYELPVHPGLIQSAGQAIDVARAEDLAAAELEVFEFLDYPASELGAELVEMGVKVIHTKAPLEPDLVGAFFFEGELGPALLIGDVAESEESAFILAHELAHLVIDVNPYASRFCRWDRRTLANRNDSPEEARADRFARALLVPPRLLGERIREMGGELRLDVLMALFGVPEVLLATRLRELGQTLPKSTAARERRTIEEPAADAIESRLVRPDRFVNLAAAAWVERLIEHPLLAQFLGVPEVEARALLEWLGVERRQPRDQSIN